MEQPLRGLDRVTCPEPGKVNRFPLISRGCRVRSRVTASERFAVYVNMKSLVGNAIVTAIVNEGGDCSVSAAR